MSHGRADWAMGLPHRPATSHRTNSWAPPRCAMIILFLVGVSVCISSGELSFRVHQLRWAQFPCASAQFPCASAQVRPSPGGNHRASRLERMLPY
jgi:hypothetical protein